MRLSLRQLEIFVAVADCGATSAAGREIALSQSAVSSGLIELESMLGRPLFDRIGKRLALNEAGRDLLPDARALLTDARAIEARFVAGTRAAVRFPTRLRIAASTTIGNYLMPHLVAGFCRTEPDARIDVQIGNTHEVEALVARHAADLGFIEGPCHDGALEATPWIDDELVIVAAPTHPLASVARVSLAQLRAASWLLRETGSGTREEVERALLPRLHQLRATMQLGGTEAIKQATIAGLGITCLSMHAVRDLVTSGRVVVIATRLPAMRRLFYRVRLRGRRESEGSARFVAFATPPEAAARPRRAGRSG